MCAGSSVWRAAFQSRAPSPGKYSQRWVFWSKYEFIFFAPQTGLGGNTAGTGIQVPIWMRDRKRNSDLFCVQF